MVGKTPRILKDERARFETIKIYCGCLPCLLMGHPDRHTSIEHVTERGRRVGVSSEQHRATIGMCVWHHFGVCNPGQNRQYMMGEYGASLAQGRTTFEEDFGDEVHVLIPVQNFLLDQFADRPWPEHNVPRHVARLTRERWIELNASAQSRLRTIQR